MIGPNRQGALWRPATLPDAPRSGSSADAGGSGRSRSHWMEASRRQAFDVIVERHRRNVYQLCYRFVGNHEDASDLAQDVFVRAFRGLQNFKGEASLGTWLYRIGVNVCLNKVGAKSPRPEALDPLLAA